jgi:inorganic pyrophosphatase
MPRRPADPALKRAPAGNRRRVKTVGADGRRTVEVLVEISRGSRTKYELDEESGRLRLDRVLHSSVHYPTDYGFIPGTLASDGDHLDVLLIVEEPAVPGSLQEARPVGVLDMSDEKGRDQKVLAVPTGDPRFTQIKNLDDVPRHWLREIHTFFDTYKSLESGKEAVVRGWRGSRAAWQAIDAARRAFDERELRKAPTR